jgi:hypothetical protein
VRPTVTVPEAAARGGERKPGYALQPHPELTFVVTPRPEGSGRRRVGDEFDPGTYEAD